MLRRKRTLLILVLASAGGLLAAGIVGLWRTVREADARVRSDAVRQAADHARSLRAALRDPRVIDLVDAATRFTVTAGQLDVPDAVGWVDAPPETPALLEIPGLAADLLARARQVEFGAGDAAAAGSLLREALGTLAVPETLPALIEMLGASDGPGSEGPIAGAARRAIDRINGRTKK